MTDITPNVTETTLSPTEVTSLLGDLQTPGISSEAPQGSTVEVKTEPKEFFNTLAQELQDIPALRKFKDVDSLAKSYINAEKMLGKKLEGMSPEELKAVYGKMNSVPENPEGYKFEGVDLDDDSIAFIQRTAHDLNLTPEQASKLASTFSDVDNSALKLRAEQSEIAKQEAAETLKKDWGKQLDYKIGLANKAMVEFGGEELAQQIVSLGLGNNVQLIKAFAKVGESLMESSLVGETGLGQFSMSPEQAGQKIEQNKRSREFMAAYLNERNPGHRAAVKEMNELWAVKTEGLPDPLSLL